MRKSTFPESMRFLRRAPRRDVRLCICFQFLFRAIDERCAFADINLRNLFSVLRGRIFDFIGDLQSVLRCFELQIFIQERSIAESVSEHAETAFFKLRGQIERTIQPLDARRAAAL